MVDTGASVIALNESSAALIGIYGLTLVAVPMFALPIVMWTDWRHGSAGDGDDLKVTGRGALVAVAVGTALPLVVILGWGAVRLSGPSPDPVSSVRLRLVQPSIPQREKWQGHLQVRNFERHLDLSQRNANGDIDGAKGIQLIVWPEAAMPFRPLDTPAALTAIGEAVPDGAHLVAGLLRVEEVPPHATGRARRVLNSLAAFDSRGQPTALYDKTHLVPFGEYLPFQVALESIGLEQLTRIRGGFDVGPTPRPLVRIAGLPPFAPLICYEAIFPGAVVQTSERPAALLNLTNDGWFGNTTGPRQHLHQTRVRAVEEGLPAIRSANNGISAVIDARGQTVVRLELNVVGVADADLPG
ncbi:MAG: apolipoprotein N-acyltransferase, partial [Hyphomicrobium sp.]|nr:apolipoprotein N-acyltransferase [Hyphomicrobium sp.]